MKTLQVSLSRAHKIAERLKILWNSSQEEAERLASPVRFVSRPSESTLADVANAGTKLFEVAKTAGRYAAAWSTVRHAIATENVKRGIDEQLTQMEVLRKSKSLWEKAYKASVATGHLPSEASSYQPDQTQSVSIMRSSFDLTVNALRDPSTSTLVKATHDEQERKWIALQDLISESNVAKVAFVLEDDIADEVTGAPVQ